MKNLSTSSLKSKIYINLFNSLLKTNGFDVVNYFGNVSEYHKIFKKGIYEIMVHPDICNGKIINRSTGTLLNPIGMDLHDELLSVLPEQFEGISYNML